MKVTRTLSLSWACAQQMVPGPLVVAVLSFFVSLCFYLCMSLFSCLLSMTKQCNENKTKQFSLNKILNADINIFSIPESGILTILRHINDPHDFDNFCLSPQSKCWSWQGLRCNCRLRNDCFQLLPHEGRLQIGRKLAAFLSK